MPKHLTAKRFELDLGAENEAEALVGPPGQWRGKRDLQLKFLQQFELAENDKFLDLGCGSMRAGLPLIEFLNEGHYTGVDIDPDCISTSQKLILDFNLNHKSPRLLLSRSFGLEEIGELERFDFIWIFQVLIHLTHDHVECALRSVSTFLTRQGRAYASVALNDNLRTLNLQGKWRHYSYNNAPLSYYKENASKVGLKVQEIGSFDADGWTEEANPARYEMLKITKK